MDLVNHLEGRLLFAVPKKGRLNSAALNLLEGADIQFRRENRLDIALVKNHPIALIFLPAADIPTFVGQGRVDLGITGKDQVKEYEASVSHRGSDEVSGGCKQVMKLGFGGCKLQVQVPEKGAYATTKDLVGKTIGTSFVHLAADHFAKLEAEADGEPNAAEATAAARKLRTQIVELSGSVEAACALGVAEGIVDLVESGETMRAAGLKAIDTVADSTAVLIKSQSPSNPDMVKLIAARIKGVITAQKYVLCQYNIPRKKLADAKGITKGKRAPTVITLYTNEAEQTPNVENSDDSDEADTDDTLNKVDTVDTDDWVAVSVMVKKKEIAQKMDNLTRFGAQDILVLDIHNTRILHGDEKKTASLTLRDLTVKFMKFTAERHIPPEYRNLYEYFKTHYKNSNKGIKGRGKARKVATVESLWTPVKAHQPPPSVPHPRGIPQVPLYHLPGGSSSITDGFSRPANYPSMVIQNQMSHASNPL